MLRECIQTVEEVNGDMDEGQPRFITTVLTCEGDLHDPGFPNRLQSLVGKLNSLISKEKEPFCVEKVEPWNSVRVTFTIPWDAALRLRHLAQQGDQVLRDLGILSVQIEGDQVITLTLANRYSEPQELVFKTSTTADASSETTAIGLELSESHTSASALGHLLLSNAVKPNDVKVASRSVDGASGTAEESIVNGNVAFQSPNVVAPSSRSPPPFKTNAAALMSQKSYTQNPVSSGPFPFASMTYAMNTKHAAANSQSTKHIRGCSSRFPFTPPFQRSASSAWMPYVSHKAVTSSSSTTSVIANTNLAQSNLSTSQHQNQCTNVTFSNSRSNATGEVEGTVVSQTAKAKNVLSSPLLINLLQNETSSKFSHSKNASPVSSPTLQPPAKRKRKPKKSKEADLISRRTYRSDVINGHMISLPGATNSASVMVSQNSSVVSTSKIQPLHKTLSPFFAASSPEEQTFMSNKSQSPLHRENSANSVPFQSFSNTDLPVRNFQTATDSMQGGVNAVCTSASSAKEISAKNSSPVNEIKKLAPNCSLSNCTPFPSPPPSADGKVKHLINPFTGHLEPMPSDDEEDDECIGSLSLFPELEMMDTNDGGESDKNVVDRCDDKQNLQKLLASDCMQDSQMAVNTHIVQNDVMDALMCKKPDVYTHNPCVSASEQNHSLVQVTNVNPSDLTKLSNIQALGNLPKELKKSFYQRDIPAAIENHKMPVRSSTPITNGSSPLPAQVSQVDLSFLQPHLQNWKSVPNRGKNGSSAYNSYIKPEVTENFTGLPENLVKTAKHQENIENSTSSDAINSVVKSKYPHKFLGSSKALNMTKEILKGSHSVNDSFHVLKSRISKHNTKLLPEFSAGSEKLCSNVDSVNLPTIKEVPNAAFTRPAVFLNKFTVLDTENVDRATNRLKQVYHLNTNCSENITVRKQQLNNRATCQTKSGFQNACLGIEQTCEKDMPCISKIDDASGRVIHSIESVVNPVIHETDPKFSNSLNLGSCTVVTASYSNSSPSVVVSSCDAHAVMSFQVNSIFRPSPDNSDSKEFKQSPLERQVISPQSNPHFETPPDSRSPISGINCNDKLLSEGDSSFDVIRKETLFNPGKYDIFLTEMMNSNVEIRKQNENSSEQCSMSSLITTDSNLKPEISMHKKHFANIPLCENPSSDKAIFSINTSLNTAYSGSGRNLSCETEKSNKELFKVSGEGNLDQVLNSTVLSPLPDQSKSLQLKFLANEPNSSLSCSACPDETKKSDSANPEVSDSSISYQLFDDTSVNVSSMNCGKQESPDDSDRKISQQEGHFTSENITKSSKTYDFMDNNISKPPEQLPLEIFENSESESQSPASSFDGESQAYFAGKDKLGINVPLTVCGPLESHHSSQGHRSNMAPSDLSVKDIPESSPCFVSDEVFMFQTCQDPLHDIFETNLTVTSPSKLIEKCIASQAASYRVADNPLSCRVSNATNVHAGGSVTTTSASNVPSSVSLSVPTVSMASSKSPCESTKKFANGSALKSYHVEINHSKNPEQLPALEEPFQSADLKNSLPDHGGTSVASSQTSNPTEVMKQNTNMELTNSFVSQVSDDISLREELGSSELSFALRDYPLLTSPIEAGKAEDTFSSDFVEADAYGSAGHLFTNSSTFDNSLGLSISDVKDSKLLLSESRGIDRFPDYNAVAQKFVPSVDDKLVSEIKRKLNISRDLKLNRNITAVGSSFSSDLQHTERYDSNNCVTIVSTEELQAAGKKSNRSYSEDSFGDSSIESPYRNSDPLDLEYNICDYKFDSVDRSLRPKHRNGSTCLIEDEADSPSGISGSLLFASASNIGSTNAKVVFQSSHENIKALNGRKDVNAACAIVEIRNTSLFDGTKLLNPRKNCILSPRIGGEEQLQGIKRRRLSADSLR